MCNYVCDITQLENFQNRLRQEPQNISLLTNCAILLIIDGTNRNIDSQIQLAIDHLNEIIRLTQPDDPDHTTAVYRKRTLCVYRRRTLQDQYSYYKTAFSTTKYIDIHDPRELCDLLDRIVRHIGYYDQILNNM